MLRASRKKIELAHAGRLGQDDEVLRNFIDSEHRTGGELWTRGVGHFLLSEALFI